MGSPRGTTAKGAKFLGVLTADPTTSELNASDEPGWWWFNSTDGVFKYWDGDDVSIMGGTYTKRLHLLAENLGLPNTNPPTVVDQDNLTLLKFTVDTDHITTKWQIPSDYDSGDFSIHLEWTNDGGVDDNGKNVKWEMDYQVGSEGDVISGSHANSPKTVEDTYNSASGWVFYHTGEMEIAEADFSDESFLFIKIGAIAAPATALSCEPHLICLCISYTAKRSVL